ncbi:hypothetical protein FSP39_001088 [Pinctada imbricata]|uniref:G-protein coupled receptors family 1 profile domain-containing protein n=1 Tax=Pinctada imbricata TaxID=66713 RepID=A0AA88YUI2_PINIB|nr:hypothetical protein FSP39_001088 [Pinctada imbricata]
MENSSLGFEYEHHSGTPSAEEILMHIPCGEKHGHTDYFSPAFTGIVASVLILIAIFAILGNIMVILVVLKNRSMRDTNRGTNFFLCNLAIADLLVGVLNIPFSVHTLIKECWDFPQWFCTVNSFSMSLFYGVSMHTLMYISIHKFISIRRTYRNYFIPIPNKVCYVMIVLTWVWGFLLALLTTVLLSSSVYKPKTMQCGPKYPKFEDISFILHGVNQFVGIYTPLFIMIFAYVKIFIYIKSITVARKRLSGDGETTVDSGQKGVVKTLVIVLACFFLCWTPYVTYTNYATFTKDKGTLPYFLNPVAYIFGFLNSACNPIIYAWRFPDFRKGYWDIIKRTTYVVTIESSSKVTTPTESHPNGNHPLFSGEDSVPLREFLSPGDAEDEDSEQTRELHSPGESETAIVTNNR